MISLILIKVMRDMLWNIIAVHHCSDGIGGGERSW